MIEKAIVFTSNTGHAGQYADLLSASIGLPAFRLGTESLEKGTPIVFIGWLMAGNVKGLEKALKRYDVHAVGIVGMAHYGTGGQDEKVIAHYQLENIKVCYMQGGFEMEKLHGVYRCMMSMMRRMVGKNLEAKKDRTPDEDEMLDLMKHGRNMVDRENLQPLIQFLQEENEKA